MRYAKNSLGMRICADEAHRNEDYFCPTCNQQLIYKKGKVILPHFAHFPNKPCIDTWEYNDQSTWQWEWMNKFPEECQEVVVTHGQQSHRADVLICDHVILFLDAAITNKFFQEKTRFFLADNKSVIWVIHAEEDIAAGILRVNRKDRNSMFWDHPPICLKKVNLKKDKKLHIILDMGAGGLRKVEWVAPESNFERFIIDSAFTPDLLTAEGRKEVALNQYARFDAFKQRNMPWHKKASSTISAPDKRWHTCDKTGAYHCDHCKKCEHNLISEYRSANAKTNTPGGLYFYCRYPEVANEVVADENGHPAVTVPSIWLK